MGLGIDSGTMAPAVGAIRWACRIQLAWNTPNITKGTLEPPCTCGRRELQASQPEMCRGALRNWIWEDKWVLFGSTSTLHGGRSVAAMVLKDKCVRGCTRHKGGGKTKRNETKRIKSNQTKLNQTDRTNSQPTSQPPTNQHTNQQISFQHVVNATKSTGVPGSVKVNSSNVC